MYLFHTTGMLAKKGNSKIIIKDKDILLGLFISRHKAELFLAANPTLSATKTYRLP